MRTFWFVAGTAAGVYAGSRARRAVEALTVDGVHDRLTGWFAGAAVLREEARAGMVEKEAELRAQLQLPAGEQAAITAGPQRQGNEGHQGHVAPVRPLRP